MAKAKTDKTLVLDIQSLIIRHLGIQMYQKPADVISEMVANAWDADAEKVDVKITKTSIKISDDGHGMTFDECQNYFLKVGRDRRKDTGSDKSIGKKRPVLGRKGIGKFAGFGISNKITIDTTSLKTSENTVFCMDLDKIYEIDQSGDSKKEIEVLKYSEPSKTLIKKHGTKVTLFLKSQFIIDENRLLSELGRRFCLPNNIAIL
jgi:HSP90 family molecular chaperone